ncbi:hypothetical protein ACFSTE_05595 [Aquimarina hainanensis]|uniref:Polysaccharide chain length determinant N-terminal domain-containing protein n=1 Tax=Aquimarina hainanensis TaxID=1578017 RepID=A0ABW5N695_9FLAO
MSTKENSSEEIDLGQLFTLIGNGFHKLFQFIGSVFKSFFHLIILFLQFIRAHFLKFVIAIIIGIVAGSYWDYKSEKVYRSSMIVEPNFNSAQQLYNNVEFYDELAKQEEFEALAGALKIEVKYAKSIREVKIESFSDQAQKISQFSEFIQGLDSISQKLVDYEDYLENFNNINSKFHRIHIKSTNPRVAKKCRKQIVRSIEENEYFRLQKRINEQNITLSDSIIERQLLELDSLQRFYRKVKMIEASKDIGGTNINLAQSKTGELPEVALLKKVEELQEDKVELNNEKASTDNIINVISDFPNKGVLVNDWFTKKKVLLPLACLGLILIFLLLMELNRYLKQYQN